MTSQPLISETANVNPGTNIVTAPPAPVEADPEARVSSDGVDLESFNADPQESEVGQNQITEVKNLVSGDDRVSKKDLVQLLEGFVSILKTDSQGEMVPYSPQQGLRTDVQVNDRTVEIDSLRNLVIEAQDTIIKLLTDRVEDRAKIAGLETQLSIVPDLQAQADRAMMVAIKTEDYRSELTKVKFELDRFRLFRVRTEVEKRKGTVWTKIQRWLWRRPNITEADAVKPLKD